MNTCDCPICLENIEGNINKTTTECGHSFHTNCLMQNAAHNGFGCPYCRSALAQSPVVEIDDSDDEYSEYSEESDIFSDDSLSAFRRLFNISSEIDEGLEEREREEEEDYDDEEEIPMAPLEVVVNKFKNINITYEQLVEYVLRDYVNEYHEINLQNNSYKLVYTKLREIDSNFNRNENNLLN